MAGLGGVQVFCDAEPLVCVLFLALKQQRAAHHFTAAVSGAVSASPRSPVNIPLKNPPHFTLDLRAPMYSAQPRLSSQSGTNLVVMEM